MLIANDYEKYAPLCLRLAIGSGFIVHGWAKISRGTAGFAKLLTYLDIPFPQFAAPVTAYVELIGGVAIFVGAFVVISAIPLIITMLVALLTIHISHGFSSVNTIGLTSEGPQFGPPGYEMNLLYIAGLVALMLTGAGRLSLDYWLKSRNRNN